MKLGFLLVGWAVGTSAFAADMVFTSPSLGLSFTYPKTWKFTLKKTHAELAFPVNNGGSQAKLQILDANFRSASDTWQTMQADVVKTQKRTLVKQWDEVYLGAPMLYTLSEYEDKGFAMSTLSGLLYARTDPKFQFRMDVPKAGYEEAETKVRAVLLTMRTETGGDYLSEEPGQELPKPLRKPTKERPFVSEVEKVAPPAPTQQHVFKPQSAPKNPEVGPLAVDTLLAGNPAKLLFAKGWTAANSDATVSLTHPNLPGVVKVQLHSVVTAPSPSKMFDAMMADDLKTFQKVDARRDSPMQYSRAGYAVVRAIRAGVVGEKSVVSTVAVGSANDQYWVLTYTGLAAEAKKNSALLDGLIRTLAFEVKA